MERIDGPCIGCCTEIQQLEQVCKAGYDFINLSGAWLASLGEQEFQQILGQSSAWPIPCRGLNSAIAPQVKICGPGFDPAQAAVYAERLCRRASAIGVEIIGVGSPKARGIYGNADFEREWEDTRRFLCILSDAAAEYGMQICWEPLNALETPFGIHWRESWTQVRILREAGYSNLWMLLDLYHLALQPYHMEEVLESAPWIKHIHIACPDEEKGRRYPQIEDLPQLRRILGQLRGAGWDSDLSTEVFTGDLFQAGQLLVEGLCPNFNSL